MHDEKVVTFIGDRIKEWREKRGLTQEMLASKSDISQAFIGKLENNKCNASLPVLFRIAEALNIPVSYLVEPNLESIGEIVDIKEFLDQIDEETRSLLNISNKAYLGIIKDMKQSNIGVAEIKSALEIIKRYKNEKNE